LLQFPNILVHQIIWHYAFSIYSIYRNSADIACHESNKFITSGISCSWIDDVISRLVALCDSCLARLVGPQSTLIQTVPVEIET